MNGIRRPSPKGGLPAAPPQEVTILEDRRVTRSDNRNIETYTTGDVIPNEDNSFYIVNEGSVAVRLPVDTPNGPQAFTLYHAVKGDTFNEGAFSEGKVVGGQAISTRTEERKLRYVAETNVKLLRIVDGKLPDGVPHERLLQILLHAQIRKHSFQREQIIYHYRQAQEARSGQTQRELEYEAESERTSDQLATAQERIAELERQLATKDKALQTAEAARDAARAEVRQTAARRVPLEPIQGEQKRMQLQTVGMEQYVARLGDELLRLGLPQGIVQPTKDEMHLLLGEEASQEFMQRLAGQRQRRLASLDRVSDADMDTLFRASSRPERSELKSAIPSSSAPTVRRPAPPPLPAQARKATVVGFPAHHIDDEDTLIGLSPASQPASFPKPPGSFGKLPSLPDGRQPILKRIGHTVPPAPGVPAVPKHLVPKAYADEEDDDLKRETLVGPVPLSSDRPKK